MNEMLETLGKNAKEAEIVLRNLDTAKKNGIDKCFMINAVLDGTAHTLLSSVLA